MDLFFLISYLGPLIAEHSGFFLFIVSLFFGEEVFLVFSFLSANGVFSLGEVLIFCFLGRITSDFFFILMGRLHFEKFLSRYQKHFIYERIDKVFSKFNRRNSLVTLIYIKFLMGIRGAMLFYIGHKRVSIKNTLAFDAVAIFVWMAVLAGTGWFAGSSFKTIYSVFENFVISLLFLFLILLALLLIKDYFQMKFKKKNF